MYNQPKNHSPRKGPVPGLPRRSRTFTGSGGSSVTVYTRGAPIPAPANTPGRIRKVSDNTVRNRVRKAISDAFPKNFAKPYSGWERGLASTAARFGQAIADAKSVGEEVAETMNYVDDALANQWWLRSPPYTGPNPGLAFLETRKHTTWAAGNYTPPANAGWTSATDYRLIGQNTWLRSTTYQTPPLPTGFLDNRLTPGQAVPNNHFLYIPNADYDFRPGTPKNFYANTRIYRNLSGAAMPAIVTVPAAFPLPLGAPLPVGVPDGYPLAKPQTLPRLRRATNPRRVEEVAIEIPPGSRPVPRVYPARARKPGPKAKETKSYGNAAAASFVFWAYENTDDWKDWVNIIVSAIPSAPGGMSPTEQLIWLRNNPRAITEIDWARVISDFAGWAVDEAFGAFVGRVNAAASRSTAVSTQTVDMRNNVALHYSNPGTSPGSWVADFIYSFT